jgi:hypothetical protein
VVLTSFGSVRWSDDAYSDVDSLTAALELVVMASTSLAATVPSLPEGRVRFAGVGVQGCIRNDGLLGEATALV